MKKILLSIVFLLTIITVQAQEHPEILYKKTTAMIPMRDGVKLFTVILYPANTDNKQFPILITRTPYGADIALKEDTAISLKKTGLAVMAADGYIFIYQDIRGKFKSEGTMQIHMPLIHRTEKGAIDESTDTYDSVDWLIKNVKNNNGKAGIYGVSYPGWLALVGAVDPHPALKAASEQACMSDLFLGDDFHHNGAFRLSYGMEYSYGVEHDHSSNSSFPFPQYDLYSWYIKLGSLSNVNAKYFHGTIPTWNTFVEHPNYDAYWQKNSPLNYVPEVQVPMLHVGGYYDQEDMNGPQLMYAKMEKTDKNGYNHIVLGPWNHGQWAQRKADSLGAISFGSNTADWFKILQKKWFDYYLKGDGDGKFEEAYAFQTGNNKWKTYNTWPPKEAAIKKLYAGPKGTCSFSAPAPGTVQYVSDPSTPVPYRTLPIEATYGPGSRWYTWHVEDQRFVSTRPDVATFTADSLTDDLTVTGQITAHLVASTTGTDADWVVKLIDVYPNFDKNSLKMSGFELPVAMEVFRGRFRKSFSKPEPLIPGKPEEFTINLHQINHTFKKGHRLMIQVQSTWFPVIDRNPQKYVPNIFEAKNSDYIKAEQSIYLGASNGTYIEIPVMNN